MKRCLLIFIIAVFALNVYSQKIEAEWESINSRPYPQWFKDAKLGIFIHWGVYSVPAIASKEGYAEWYLRGLQVGDSNRIAFQKSVFGENFEYCDFADEFKAELWNPNEWAELFKNSGAKYVLLVSKHHDGYTLWPSKYSPNWNSVETGPKRDIVGELSEAVRNEGLKMGLYFSLAEWNNELYRWYIDPKENVTRYVVEYMIPQFKELISTYKPSVLFTDGEWSHNAETWHARELISYYYNTVGEDAIVNNRWGHGCNHGFLTPEYSSGLQETQRPWAECRGLGRSFALNRTEKLDAYMTPEELIHFFAKAVAHGGGITLNVGPKADGQIPLLQQERLLQLGDWLKINGEAIYGSEKWKKTGELKDYTFERIDTSINFNWVRNRAAENISEDNFTVEWTGYITADYSEEYTFIAEADDGIELWINDELILKQGKFQKNSESNAMEREEAEELRSVYKFKKGKLYSIKVKYTEIKQNASVKLSWKSKSQKLEVIPKSNLFLKPSSKSLNGLKAIYKSQDYNLVYTKNNGNIYAIALEWPDDKLVLNIPKPTDNLKISLLGREGNLNWKYENKQLIIDLSEIKYSQMPGHYAWVFRLEN